MIVRGGGSWGDGGRVLCCRPRKGGEAERTGEERRGGKRGIVDIYAVADLKTIAGALAFIVAGSYSAGRGTILSQSEREINVCYCPVSKGRYVNIALLLNSLA